MIGDQFRRRGGHRHDLGLTLRGERYIDRARSVDLEIETLKSEPGEGHRARVKDIASRRDGRKEKVALPVGENLVRLFGRGAGDVHGGVLDRSASGIRDVPVDRAALRKGCGRAHRQEQDDDSAGESRAWSALVRSPETGRKRDVLGDRFLGVHGPNVPVREPDYVVPNGNRVTWWNKRF